MPFDMPQTGSLAGFSRPDPMRAIIAGLRRASQPGEINQLGSEMDFYGRGDPLDMEIAEEARRTEHDRGMRRLDQSAATFVDPRLERDNPALAAKARLDGAGIAAAMPAIEDGPLAKMLNSARMTSRTMPMTRGVEREQATLDANAEAENYSHPAQAGMRDSQRWDKTLDAKAAANTFMNPVVRQGREAMRAEAPADAGLEALVDFIRQSGGNQYGGVNLQDIMTMFNVKGVNAPPPPPPRGQGPIGTGPQPQASRGPAVAPNGQTMSMARIRAMAQAEGTDPDDVADDLRSQGFTITP
jgi:hypothetical protein